MASNDLSMFVLSPSLSAKYLHSDGFFFSILNCMTGCTASTSSGASIGLETTLKKKTIHLDGILESFQNRNISTVNVD